MPTIFVTGCRLGFDKVACTKALQSSCELSLAQAKAITDGVVAGRMQRLEPDTLAKAEALTSALTATGALVRTEEPGA